MMKALKNVSIFFSLLTIVLSCNNKPSIEDFDTSKLKKNYSFDINYTNEKFKELKSNNTSVGGIDNLTMMGLLAISGDIVFYQNSKGFFNSVNKLNSQNRSGNYFQYKIENDSIIYLKVDDYDDTTEDKFIKSAILIEYGNNYEYFVIKPITDTYKNFEFKAIAEE